LCKLNYMVAMENNNLLLLVQGSSTSSSCNSFGVISRNFLWKAQTDFQLPWYDEYGVVCSFIISKKLHPKEFSMFEVHWVATSCWLCQLTTSLYCKSPPKMSRALPTVKSTPPKPAFLILSRSARVFTPPAYVTGIWSNLHKSNYSSCKHPVMMKSQLG